MQTVLGRRGDAGLVGAAEGVGARADTRLAGSGSGLTGTSGREPARGQAEAGGGRAARKEPATADPAQESTAAVRLPSGSESALTPSESCLTSAVLSWS